MKTREYIFFNHPTEETPQISWMVSLWNISHHSKIPGTLILNHLSYHNNISVLPSPQRQNVPNSVSATSPSCSSR